MRFDMTHDVPARSQRKAQKTGVMLGRDHCIHIVIDFEREVFDIPYSPDQAEALAAMLLQAARQVRGLVTVPAMQG